MDILVVIINNSGGRIENLRDLAQFLKNNVNLKEYKVTQSGGFLGFGKNEYDTTPLTTLGSCKAVLRQAFNISDAEAYDAVQLLHDANFVWLAPSDTYFEGRGSDRFVRFDI